MPLLVRRSSRRLRGTFTSLVCLTDRRRRDFHVPAPPFARVLRALLASSLRSALRIAGPKAAPACSSTSVRIIEKGSFARGAGASAAAKGLFAALRLLRWARSRTHGCVWQFGAGQDGRSPNGPSAQCESRRYRASGARTARDAADVSEPARKPGLTLSVSPSPACVQEVRSTAVCRRRIARPALRRDR